MSCGAPPSPTTAGGTGAAPTPAPSFRCPTKFPGTGKLLEPNCYECGNQYCYLDGSTIYCVPDVRRDDGGAFSSFNVETFLGLRRSERRVLSADPESTGIHEAVQNQSDFLLDQRLHVLVSLCRLAARFSSSRDSLARKICQLHGDLLLHADSRRSSFVQRRAARSMRHRRRDYGADDCRR